MSGSHDLWGRLERLLHREKHAARLGHRDLMSLPLSERVERGDSLGGLRYIGEAEGRLRLRCPDNQAKFRAGDSLRLWSGDDDPVHLRRYPGIAVGYVGFDDRTGSVVVERDRWAKGGDFDRTAVLQLDPQDNTLVEVAIEALSLMQSRSTPEAVSARNVLEQRAEVTRREDAQRWAATTAKSPALDFDPAKREAFVAAAASDPVCLVQGPPGSGKTFLLAHVVAALARRGERILVTAHTHRAVNNVLRKLSEVAPEVRCVKAGRDSGADDLKPTFVERAPSMRRLPPSDGRATVVGTTVFGLKAAWDLPPWDRVVFDEAAQVPLAYAPIAMMLGRRYLFVGDHRQLGPIVQGQHDDGLAGMSVFEHLAASYPPVLLTTTYRMNDGINAFPSAAFYGGRLQPADSAATRRFAAEPGGPFDAVFDPEHPAIWLAVEHEGFRTRCEPEARAVAALACDLLARQKLPARDLAIVSPYRAQLRLIRTLLARELAAVHAKVPSLPVIDTVERIQGQEREAVIVSLCASDPEWLAGEQAEFFFSPNRLNVTLTRARTKLVVVGSPMVARALPGTLERLIDADRVKALLGGLRRIPAEGLGRD